MRDRSERIERHVGGAGHPDAVHGYRGLQASVKEDADPVAALHTLRAQGRGQRARAAQPVAVRQRLAVAAQGRLLGRALGGALKDVVQQVDQRGRPRMRAMMLR